MEIKYRLTETDFINFNVLHQKTSKNLKRRLLVNRVVTSLIYLFIALYFAYSKKFTNEGIMIAIPFLLLAISWFLYLPALVYRSAKKVAKKMLHNGRHDSILGDKTLSIENNVLYEVSESSKTDYDVSSIIEVKETDLYIFIYVSRISAIIIPKSGIEHKDLLQSLQEMNITINKFAI